MVIYDKHISIFCLVFLQIQLIEYFMWSDQNCGKLNHYSTIAAHILLMLQPISVILFGMIFETFNISRRNLTISLIILIIPLIIVIIKNIINKKQLCSKEKQTGYLEWYFVNGNSEKWSFFYIIYFIGLIVPWIFLKNKFKGHLISFILLFTLTISKLNFEQWESIWCFIAVIIPSIFLLINNNLK